MSDPAIQIENISKKYIIAGRTDSLRELLSQRAKNLCHQISRPFGYVPEVPVFETFWALQDVSCQVEQGSRLGILGRNGAGKSTLLKILSRITEPTTGRALLRGRVSSLLEVGTGLHGELTGIENIYLYGAILGMSRGEVRKKFDEIVAFSELDKFIHVPLKYYSSGMKIRLGFAVAAHLVCDILMIDEALAVGDIPFQKKCVDKMNELATAEGRTVIFVTHTLSLIQTFCKEAMWLQAGRMEAYGPVHEVIEKYLASLNNSGNYLPGTLFEINLEPQEASQFHILKVLLLDEAGDCKDTVKTWDHLRFRIYLHSPQACSHGSLSINLSPLSQPGGSLVNHSTQHSGHNLHLPEGESFVDCVFPKIPLASGTYEVKVGLHDTMTQKVLCNEENMAPLTIQNQDIYRSGYFPSQKTTIMVVDHFWESQGA
jgi:lipopolysaccharide transport system ATP-binding protein